MIVSEIKLYELLKAKIGEREAEAFIQILETKVESKLLEKTSVFATKEDVAKLETKISEAKVDIIKWMVATAIAIVGLIVAFMKFI
jgi:hypothetical protein